MLFCGSVILWFVLSCQWRVGASLDTVEELLCGNMDPGSRLPHPEFCNVYIICTNQSAMQISCERRILYNPDTDECDPEYQVCLGGLIRNQDGTILEYDEGEEETDSPELEEVKDEEVSFSEGEYFTPTTETTTTKVSPTSTGDVSITTQQSSRVTSCPSEDPEKLLLIGHPSKCSIYFVCYHGRPVPMECSLGLYWSEKNYKCVPRELSECHASISSPYPECPEQGIDFLPDERNCQHFWYCRDGYRTLQQCDAFFQWDINERKCKRIGQSVCYLDLLKLTTATPASNNDALKT